VPEAFGPDRKPLGARLRPIAAHPRQVTVFVGVRDKRLNVRLVDAWLDMGRLPPPYVNKE
jgi:hypothetical protein